MSAYGTIMCVTGRGNPCREEGIREEGTNEQRGTQT